MMILMIMKIILIRGSLAGLSTSGTAVGKAKWGQGRIVPALNYVR
jgi:hypothetical protein